MSELFEGLVVAQPQASVQAAIEVHGSPLRFRVLFRESYTIAERLADREDHFSPDLATLAEGLSRSLGPIVTFQYDSRVGYRSASLFNAGVHQLSFGEDDEHWVPLAPDGQPMLQAQRLHVSDLKPDQDYETVMNAIDLGLEQLAGSSLRWETLHDLLSED